MTKEAVVELDSWRLAQYAFQVPCYICEGPNQFDAELCRHCCAPMALSQQSRDQKVQPRLVGTIGPPGVGEISIEGYIDHDVLLFMPFVLVSTDDASQM